MEIDAEKLNDIIDRLERSDDDKMDIAKDLRLLMCPEILPCPCCGSTAEYFDDGHGNIHIMCSECALRTGSSTPDIVVAAWNRRTPFEIKVEYADQLTMERKEDDGAEDGSVRQDQQ